MAEYLSAGEEEEMKNGRGAGEVILMHRLSVYPGEPGPYQDMTDSPSCLEQFLANRTDHVTGCWPDVIREAQDNPWYILTFDDGYRDNLLEALPLLERHGVPAIIFVTVGFLDRQLEPFSAYIARLLYQQSNVRIKGKSWSLRTLREREVAQRALYKTMDRGTLRSRWLALERLLNENDFAPPSPCEDIYLSWDELRELASHPLITIGAHSWTHPRLSRIPPWELSRELRKSRQRLEKELGVSVSMLAYPHGASNYLVRQAATLAGYKYAFSTKAQVIQPCTHINTMQIPRLSLNSSLIS